MSKKYQIFVSSTYEDLKQERQEVIKSILEYRHIPVGMEYFAAADEEQFKYIKQILDETDYYIIIIGNRYGSKDKDGISYTEKEFDYAVSKHIPIIACIHSDPDSLPVNRSDSLRSDKVRLNAFKNKIKTGRMVRLISWKNPSELVNVVMAGLIKSITDNPREGWIRADSNKDLIDSLQKKIRDLETKLDDKQKPDLPPDHDETGDYKNLIKEIYTLCNKFRSALADNAGQTEINNVIVSLAQAMRRLYSIYETNKCRYPAIADAASAIVEHYNTWVNYLQAWVAIPVNKRQTPQAILVSKKTNDSFQVLMEAIIKELP